MRSILLAGKSIERIVAREERVKNAKNVAARNATPHFAAVAFARAGSVPLCTYESILFPHSLFSSFNGCGYCAVILGEKLPGVFVACQKISAHQRQKKSLCAVFVL